MNKGDGLSGTYSYKRNRLAKAPARGVVNFRAARSAARKLKLRPHFFPSWALRIYVDASVPADILTRCGAAAPIWSRCEGIRQTLRPAPVYGNLLSLSRE